MRVSIVQKTSPHPPEAKQRFPGDLTLEIYRDSIKTFTRIARECGDIAHFKIGGNHVFLLNNPEYIKDVLITHHRNFIKSEGLRIAKSILGEGLLTSEEGFHHRK